MKKIFVLLAISLLSINAFAARIPSDKLASYQEAAAIAIHHNPLICSFTPETDWGTGSLESAIKTTTSGYLNEKGEQPLVVFSFNDGSTKYTFKVRTSADYKSVVSVHFEQKECETKTHNENLGDISNPQIEARTSTKCEVKFKAVCE